MRILCTKLALREKERLTMKIGIVDYKMGNIASLQNSFEKIGKSVSIVHTPEDILSCDKLILPGVGGFGDAMTHLKEQNFIEPIQEYVQSGNNLLGVCLGMQLLFTSSNESLEKEGLDLIPGSVTKFDKSQAEHTIKIPHMGWNKMEFVKESKLFLGLKREAYLYFVHSYHGNCDKRYIIGQTYYGYDFVSAVEKENIYGFQPHPEKSHNEGLQILENFIKI